MIAIERIPTKVWAEALMRRAENAGASAFVLQSGDMARGDIIVKVATLDGAAHAYAPGMALSGARIFIDLAMQGIGPDEKEVDAYLARAMARDADLWVIEVEDKAGRHFLTETVERAE